MQIRIWNKFVKNKKKKEKQGGGGQRLCTEIFTRAIRGLVRLLFCPPSSVPETSPGQKPTLILLFLPPPPSSQILAEGAAGNRARSQSDRASVSGCGRIVGQAGEFYMGGSDWLQRKWLLLQAAGRAAIETS